MKMEKNVLIAGALALVIGLGGGYFGAHAFAAKAPSGARGMFAAGAGGAAFMRLGTGANQAMGGLLSGTVASMDSGSITLDTRDGSSHLVLVTPATSVQKSVAGSLADVTKGATIIVTGSTNSDGSVAASSIQLRPAMPPATMQ